MPSKELKENPVANVCAVRGVKKDGPWETKGNVQPHEPILVAEADRQEYINYREFNLHFVVPGFGAPIVGSPKKINGLGPWCRHCGCLYTEE